VPLLYSSATNNSVYRALAKEVDIILVNGDLWKIESYGYGIDVPIRSANDFHSLLVEWNQASSEGKFAPDAEESCQSEEEEEVPNVRVLLSDTPIEAVWLRLRQLHSVKLAERVIANRGEQGSGILGSEVVASKAAGVAFALRNASDYYSASEARNLSQRVLNLYYGSMAFAFAEMLAMPSGPDSLTQIENVTKQGHGLYTLDGATSDLKDIAVGIIRSGFFTSWLTTLGQEVSWTPQKKPKSFADVATFPQDSWLTLEQLFARIPEISDLFQDVFDSPTLWLEPSYDSSANQAGFQLMAKAPVSRTYGLLTDISGQLTKEDIAQFPGPFSEIKQVGSRGKARRFRVAVDHDGHKVWWNALDLHSSPLGPTAIIKPIFHGLGTYRAICLVLLYALSIIVRYRPSVWRRVQEGDLDHMRALIEAFLAVVVRVLPEHFLASVSGEKVFTRQHGSWA